MSVLREHNKLTSQDEWRLYLPCRLVVQWAEHGSWHVEGEQGDMLASGKVDGDIEDLTVTRARTAALTAAKQILDFSAQTLGEAIETTYEARLLRVPALNPMEGP